MMKSLGIPSISFTLLSTLIILCPNFSEARTVERKICANGVVSKLIVKRDRPGIEVEFEVDEVQPGQRWRVTIKQNGRTILRTVRAADGDGELEVETLTANLRGRDRFVATARSGGQKCRLRARSRF